MKNQLIEINRKMNGDRSLDSRDFETPPSISSRIGRATYGLYGSTSAPTKTMEDAYDIVSEEFTPILEELKEIVKNIQKMEFDSKYLALQPGGGRKGILGCKL